MTNSRQKGAAGEREFAHWLQDNLGATARRGQQFSGSKDSPDVVHDIEGVRFEVKRVQALNIDNAMKQAVKDAGTLLVPVVAHRKDRGDWMITIRGDDLKYFTQLIGEHLIRIRAKGMPKD